MLHWIIVCRCVFPTNTLADSVDAESFIENYVSYPAFYIFSHLAAVDERRLDDAARANLIEELYWLMRMSISPDA